MGDKASDVLLIKKMMDSEVDQYCRMALPVVLRDELIKQTVSRRMEQAARLLERFLKRYDSAEDHRRM